MNCVDDFNNKYSFRRATDVALGGILHDIDNHIVGSPDDLKILTFQPLHRSDSFTAYP